MGIREHGQKDRRGHQSRPAGPPDEAASDKERRNRRKGKSSPQPGDLCAEEQGSPMHRAESGDARGAAGCRYLEGFFQGLRVPASGPRRLLPPSSPPRNPKTTQLGIESGTGCPAPTERRLPVTRCRDLPGVAHVSGTGSAHRGHPASASEDRARVDLRRRHRKCMTVTPRVCARTQPSGLFPVSVVCLLRAAPAGSCLASVPRTSGATLTRSGDGDLLALFLTLGLKLWFPSMKRDVS
ncbi:uncharacterized protein LOC132002856 isoform X2 [Mustela nigripes]|nr:uncharacterized protein LOC132002856 isoform X2 [Mustela nigripes]